MRILLADEIDRALTFPDLINALDAAFAAKITVPVRHHHHVARPGGDATHLLMPAWHDVDGFMGVKIVNVFPTNAKRGLPSVYGTYVLMSGQTGATLAILDGARLTTWRTAAASALAARYLAAPDAQTHLMVGAGALAPFLIEAHRAVRPISRSVLWNKSPQRAQDVADTLAQKGIAVDVVSDLEAACRAADIISTATLSTEPLVQGAWLKPGAHLDLVGAFKPDMRETDDECVLRSRLFVDTRGGALKEGGDLVQPMRAGRVSEAAIEADLFDLARGTVRFERAPGDITLFKSTGTAIEDLAAAALVAARCGIQA